jgi:hypothetical protein
MLVDLAVLVIGVAVLAYSFLQARRPEPAPARETSVRRTHTVYLIGVAAGCLMIGGAVVNLLGG